MIGLDLLSGSNRKAIVALAVVVALLLTGIGCYMWGSHNGDAAATAKGKAELNELKAEHATAVSDSLSKALKRSEELVAQGNQISATLITTRADLANVRAQLNGRIHDVSATVSADCAFGPAYVGLLNAFAGLGSGNLPQAANSGGAEGCAAAGGTAGAAVRQDAPVNATPEDLAAWVRDYGAQCQDYKALAGARLQLLEAWSK